MIIAEGIIAGAISIMFLYLYVLAMQEQRHYKAQYIKANTVEASYCESPTQ